METQTIDSIMRAGNEYTVYAIGSMMAMTSKREIFITRIHIDGNPVFKERGKRTQYIFPLRSRAYSSAPLKDTESAIFEGWDQPIKCDTELNRTMRGNACYNFVATPDAIRSWIDAGQLNPNFKREHVLSVPASGDGLDEEIPVYPELYQGGHAVIDRHSKA